MKRTVMLIPVLMTLAAVACREGRPLVSPPETGSGAAGARGATMGAPASQLELIDLGLPVYGSMGLTERRLGVNESGRVLVTVSDGGTVRVYLRSRQGVLEQLASPADAPALGLALNASGDAVGLFLTDDTHAILWTRAGMRELLPGQPVPNEARGINDAGEVAGTIGSLAFVDHEARAYFWREKDGLTFLGTLPGGDGAVSEDINNRGQITGEATMPRPGGPAGALDIHAFAWSEKEGMRDLGYTGPMPSHTGANAINDRGWVVGMRLLAPGTAQRAFLWTPADGMLDIHPAGARFSMAFDVNDRGEVVGYFGAGSPVVLHGFYWSAQTGHVVLPDLVAGPTQAYSINNAGDVAGQSRPAAGGMNAVLWTRSGGRY